MYEKDAINKERNYENNSFPTLNKLKGWFKQMEKSEYGIESIKKSLLFLHTILH